MTRVHYNLPPEVAEHAAESPTLGPCALCLLYAKGAQVEATRETWQPLIHDGDDTGPAAWLPYPGAAYDIREAVTDQGFCDVFPGIPLRLCWDHLGAIAPPNPLPICKWCGGTGHKASGLEAASGPLPPGLGGNGSHKRGRG